MRHPLFFPGIEFATYLSLPLDTVHNFGGSALHRFAGRHHLVVMHLILEAGMLYEYEHHHILISFQFDILHASLI